MDGLLSFLIFAGFFYLMMRFGCGAHMIHGGHHNANEETTDVQHTDPVCGMKVDIDKGYGKMYEGSLYRFCSRQCLDQFESAPDKYLKHSDKQGGES